LLLDDLRQVNDPSIIGTYQGNFVVTSSGLGCFPLLAPSALMSALSFTHANNLSSAHLSLAESYNLFDQSMPADVFAHKVSSTFPVLKNLSAALSQHFVGEFGPAMDKENACFVTHGACFVSRWFSTLYQ
jgi:hypothetical protein